jgi:hypothetical protein
MVNIHLTTIMTQALFFRSHFRHLWRPQPVKNSPTSSILGSYTIQGLCGQLLAFAGFRIDYPVTQKAASLPSLWRAYYKMPSFALQWERSLLASVKYRLLLWRTFLLWKYARAVDVKSHMLCGSGVQFSGPAKSCANGDGTRLNTQ